MKWASKKRQKQNRIAALARTEFAAEFKFCWFCGSNYELCIDEIVSGMSGRSVGIMHRECWTRACAECNCGPLAGSSEEVLLRKLAAKYQYDRPYFDLPKVNVLRGREPGAIDMAMVMLARKMGVATR